MVLQTKSKFTFITYCDLPVLDADDRLVADELESRGATCNVADWRSIDVDWSSAGICVIRSTWDYYLHYAEFLRWLEQVSSVTTVWNHPQIVRWNSDKKYLREIKSSGIPIVPTEFFTADRKHDVNKLMSQRDWKTSVLKPSVGLSTFGVKKVSIDDPSNQAHLDELLKTSDALLQPYIDTVHERGERALVFLGGQYSHAIRKSAFQPLAQAGEAGESVVEADAQELALAHDVLKQVKAPTAFARVDLIRGSDGQDMVMELELVEPSLYLGMVKGSVARFADVLCQMAAEQMQIQHS